MKRLFTVNGLLLCVLGLSMATLAGETKAPDAKPAAAESIVPLPRVPLAISELLQDRKYAEAIKAIDAAAAAKDAAQDYLAYLKGRALHLSGQFDAAVEQFTAMQK